MSGGSRILEKSCGSDIRTWFGEAVKPPTRAASVFFGIAPLAGQPGHRSAIASNAIVAVLRFGMRFFLILLVSVSCAASNDSESFPNKVMTPIEDATRRLKWSVGEGEVLEFRFCVRVHPKGSVECEVLYKLPTCSTAAEQKVIGDLGGFIFGRSLRAVSFVCTESYPDLP